MSTFSTSAEHPSAQALGEAPRLKTFRVHFTVWFATDEVQP